MELLSYQARIKFFKLKTEIKVLSTPKTNTKQQIVEIFKFLYYLARDGQNILKLVTDLNSVYYLFSQ